MDRVTFKIFRYKPGSIDPPRYDTFEVEIEEHTTVLDVLEKLRLDDPSLTYRHSCHHASCGTCAMRVNGKEVLACVTNVRGLGTSEVVVEPLKNAPVVSDLVVDMVPFYEKYSPVDRPLIRKSEFLPESRPPEDVEDYTRLEDCIECGICLSVCPVAGSDERYMGPAALAAAARVVQEPRGKDAPAILRMVDDEHGCWRCHAAMECSAACPSNVDPGGLIMYLRKRLILNKVLGR